VPDQDGRLGHGLDQSGVGVDDLVMPIPAWLSGFARASATVSGTPGHSGMTGS